MLGNTQKAEFASGCHHPAGLAVRSVKAGEGSSAAFLPSPGHTGPQQWRTPLFSPPTCLTNQQLPFLNWMPSALNGSQLWLIFKSCSPHIHISGLLCKWIKNKASEVTTHTTHLALSPYLDMGSESQLHPLFKQIVCT